MNRKYTYDLDVFYREDALSYYLLGAWMTDGHIDVRKNRILVRLTSRDLDWLINIKDKICPALKILKRKGSNCYDLQIYSTELGRWLISKGCVPNKTFIIQMPQVPEQYFSDFLRGCVDGDGSIALYSYRRFFSKEQKSYTCYISRIQLSSASRSFIDKIKDILFEFQFK